MMTSEKGWDGSRIRALSPEWASKIIFIDECASTNDEARRLAREGLVHGSLVLTERQTAGRGRRGQAWSCPPGESLACSFLLRPEEPMQLWSRFSLVAGLAVAEALDGFGLAAEVKWPNDVWVHERKICGILVESAGDSVVIGIGLNINTLKFPEDLVHPATSIALENGEVAEREAVLVAILDRLRIRSRQIGSSFSELLETWNTRCVLRGKRVTLQTNGTRKTGVIEGLSANGELLLRTAEGLEKILHADTIRLVKSP
ncbi:MAG: biotin--[acetyl-CoA-carboxylase] ligase [Akkermansiaceae bacterium]|nr:biotin--[acetyl-CoA-carboxylase] ligase [Akkermansiaceae bacterium]